MISRKVYRIISITVVFVLLLCLAGPINTKAFAANNDFSVKRNNARQQTVNFSDSNLERVVREAIGKSTGDILIDDVKSITILNANGEGIESLEGIQYLINLEELYLKGNHVKDLMPLRKFKKLAVLDLEDNEISVLRSLKNVKSLIRLNLQNNQIINIEDLINLKYLKILNLENNDIVDIRALRKLKALQELDLRSNQITSIVPLVKLTNLRKLLLNGNSISDYTPTQAYYNNLQTRDFELNFSSWGVSIGHNCFPKWEDPAAQKMLTVYYPEGSVIKEYRIDDGGWLTYEGPMLITRNCYVSTRAFNSNGEMATGGIEFNNIDMEYMGDMYPASISAPRINDDEQLIWEVTNQNSEDIRVDIGYRENGIGEINFKYNEIIPANETISVSTNIYNVTDLIVQAESMDGLSAALTMRRADDIRYHFVNDPGVIGTWENVNFVSAIDSFNPENVWRGRLYLGDVTFQFGGLALNNSSPEWVWTKGLLINEEDMTASKYEVREIAGEQYLFIEWKSGDYTYRGSVFGYYVLRKSESVAVWDTDINYSCIPDLATEAQQKTLTIYYPEGSVRREYTIGYGEWLSYDGPIVLTEDSYIRMRAFNADGDRAMNDVEIANISPSYSGIWDEVIIHSPFPQWEEPAAQKTLTIYYPEGSVIKEYKIDDGEWLSYEGPILITRNCYVSTRAFNASGKMATGGILFYNIGTDY